MESKPDLYNKNTKRKEIVDYCERLEFKLQQEEDSQKYLPWLLYIVFLLSFLWGAGIVRVGMELLNEKAFDWFIMIIIIIVLLPFIYLFGKTIIK